MRLLLSASLLVAALSLTGCAASFDPATSRPSLAETGAVSGTAFGGRQPVSGARIYMLQANNTAYAGQGIAASSANASTSLLTSCDGSDAIGFYVLTSASGAFNLNGHTAACTSGEQVYLLSLGGKPDGVNTNTAAGLMAVLGTCGTDFSSSTTVNMNEVSTIAAAYAMAGFATDATHVGYSGSALGRTGISNAFASAKLLYDMLVA